MMIALPPAFLTDRFALFGTFPLGMVWGGFRVNTFKALKKKKKNKKKKKKKKKKGPNQTRCDLAQSLGFILVFFQPNPAKDFESFKSAMAWVTFIDQTGFKVINAFSECLDCNSLEVRSTPLFGFLFWGDQLLFSRNQDFLYFQILEEMAKIIKLWIIQSSESPFDYRSPFKSSY